MPNAANLDNMPLDALIELRETVTATLRRRIAELHRELSGMSSTRRSQDVQSPDADIGERRRAANVARSSSLKGRKVEPKYRSQKDPTLTWAGRGATPRWLRQEMKEGKLSKDAFLIAQH
jgi:DNA-binding protein H-NS